MNRNILSATILSMVAAAGLFFASSCTKTEYEQLKRPYADIERFAVAGYGTLDSIPAVISNDTIFVYWNPKAAQPGKVKPVIAISKGAVISPASGEEVDFSDQTVYTVTGEDGTTRQYRLKPVLNIAIPALFSATTARTWSATGPIVINGEYFLSTGNKQDVRVYAQRIRDGLEFDLTVDTATLTSTSINAYLPEFTSDLDTGAHRIYIKVGNFASNVAPIWLSQPPLTEIVETKRINRIGNLKLGEEFEIAFTPKENWKVAFEKYYAAANFISYNIGLQKVVPGQVINGKHYLVPADYVTVLGPGRFKVKMDPSFFGEHVSSRIFGGFVLYGGVNGPLASGGTTSYQFEFDAGLMQVVLEEVVYTEMNFQQEGQQISRGQQLTVDYTFTTEAFRITYQGKLNLVQLGFEDLQTGNYSTIDISAANITDNGTQVKFAIPATADVVGKSLVLIGTRFSGGGRNLVTSRKTLTNAAVVKD